LNKTAGLTENEWPAGWSLMRNIASRTEGEELSGFIAGVHESLIALKYGKSIEYMQLGNPGDERLLVKLAANSSLSLDRKNVPGTVSSLLAMNMVAKADWTFQFVDLKSNDTFAGMSFFEQARLLLAVRKLTCNTSLSGQVKNRTASRDYNNIGRIFSDIITEQAGNRVDAGDGLVHIMEIAIGASALDIAEQKRVVDQFNLKQNPVYLEFYLKALENVMGDVETEKIEAAMAGAIGAFLAELRENSAAAISPAVIDAILPIFVLTAEKKQTPQKLRDAAGHGLNAAAAAFYGTQG